MGRKSNTTSTSPDLTIDQVKVENETEVVKTETEDTTISHSDEPKTKRITFDAEKDYVIISKIRAGKKITANTSDVISFDEKGAATVKGTVAEYLIGSGLGFELGK